jgi:hypothetical protein
MAYAIQCDRCKGFQKVNDGPAYRFVAADVDPIYGLNKDDPRWHLCEPCEAAFKRFIAGMDGVPLSSIA